MERREAERLATEWVRAWAAGDVEGVLDLLHHDAVITDPVGGKVRKEAVTDFVRVELVGTRPDLVEWRALPGSDSVAVATVWADGVERVDTLVVADDGRIVRVMTHRTF
jgi:hypothetical protein